MFEKNQIPQDVADKVQVFVERDDFNPDAMNQEESTLASSLCQWIHCMFQYHSHIQIVKPKEEER